MAGLTGREPRRAGSRWGCGKAGLRRLALAAAFAGLAACAAPRQRRFPIGLFGVGNAAHLSSIASAGFDCIQTYRRQPEEIGALALQAKRAGLRLLAPPYGVLGSAQARAWPIEAWYLQDEPDVSHAAPEELEDRAGRVRAWDPRPLALSVGQGAAAAAYAPVTDVVMLDWYPVPHLPLGSLGSELDKARSAVRAPKRVWSIVQAFDWRDYAQRDPRKPRVGRFPTREELRQMSYLAIAHGAEGLFYYTFAKPAGRTLLDAPEQWQALRETVRELRSLQPVLEAGSEIPVPFDLSGTGLAARAWSFHRRRYVLLVNPASTSAPVPPEAADGRRWRPLFETRRDPTEVLQRAGDRFALGAQRALLLSGG